MQYVKKRERYERNYNQNNWFSKDDMLAYSYGWWCYFKVINGKNIFNNYSYSSTTNGHQSDCRVLLKELGISIDVVVYQHDSLSQGIDLKPLYKKLFQLEIEMKRKGSNKKKNMQRQSEIDKTNETIKVLRTECKAKFTKKLQNELKKGLIRLEKIRVNDMQEKRKKEKPLNDAIKAQLIDLSPVDFSVESNFNKLTAI